MCNFAGNIVGAYDEDSDCSYEKYEELQYEWYEKIKSMTLQEQEAANLGYVIFEAFYYFICYWGYTEEVITQNSIQDSCINQIQVNIFSILWYYEENTRILAEIEIVKSDILFVMENFNDNEFHDKIEMYIHLNILNI